MSLRTQKVKPLANHTQLGYVVPVVGMIRVCEMSGLTATLFGKTRMAILSLLLSGQEAKDMLMLSTRLRDQLLDWLRQNHPELLA